MARTWFQCMRIFIKYDGEYYYVKNRGVYNTTLIRLDLWYVHWLNEEFDGLLRDGLIELMPE